MGIGLEKVDFLVRAEGSNALRSHCLSSEQKCCDYSVLYIEMVKFNLISADFEHVQLNFTCCPSDAVVVTGKMCLKAAAFDFIAKK